jgi:signal transduction histidine kinase
VLVDAPADEPDPDIAVAAYRCVAEGVTNAVRHARATEVRVSVGSSDGRMRVQVADDGVGGPIALGVGLTSLRRRAEQLGGLLEIDTGPGRGTSLRVDLPMASAR